MEEKRRETSTSFRQCCIMHCYFESIQAILKVHLALRVSKFAGLTDLSVNFRLRLFRENDADTVAHPSNNGAPS